MRDAVWTDIRSDLEQLKARHLYRDPEIFPPRKGRPLGSPLQRFVDFSSNNYLGLSRHPRVIQGAHRALREWGAGSAASRLLSGNLKIHDELEKKLADFKKEEAAAIFSSGYLANLGMVRTLVNEQDVVILDRFCHASLMDGARLSRAKFWVYEHRDSEDLKNLLSRAKLFRRRLVVTDAYFSMDGDVAPIADLVDLCEKNEAILMIDEAHSTGVYGKTGRGLTEHFGVSGKVPVVMGTLSKALGSVGGFIAGSALLRETLVNFCRSFIYTTAPSPAASGAALAALDVIKTTPQLREKLWDNSRRLREGLKSLGLDLMGSEGPIVPISVGDAARVVKIKALLSQDGFLVSAIRPPSVPRGTDRIRLSVSAAHTAGQIDGLLAAFKKIRTKVS
jgi:8-amino-7-oxononanoate synthase